MSSDISGKSIVIAIADYRWKYVLYALVCWALVIAGFFTFGAKERQWQFWMAETVMFMFGSGLLYMLLNKKYYFIGRSGEAYDQWMTEKHRDLLLQDGMFSYFPDGFNFHSDDQPQEILWQQIVKISAHIEDELSNDDNIVMRIEFNDGKFIEFDEEIPGWIKWEVTIRGRFSSIDDQWQLKLLDSQKKELILFQA